MTHNFSHKRSIEQKHVDFWRYVDQPQVGCWEWQRGHNAKGYGQVWFCGEMRDAHRLAWFLAVGEIPNGLCVLHTCDNPSCCNPVHLWLGTKADNTRDALAKGRLRSLNGEKTHCKRGHEFTRENTYYRPNGYRECRTCMRARDRISLRHKGG